MRTGWGGFDDANAVSFTAAGVLAENVIGSGRGSVVLDGGVGVGTARGGVTGRAGVSFGW
jgi:trimeric autotransporter adhesin